MQDETAQTDENSGYSALTKRPAPKVVDAESSTVSYVAGVRVVDELAQRKQKFNGWEKDAEAQQVVRMLAAGNTDKFVGADLSNVDFSGAVLTAVNLSNADLKNADLRGADLRGADLRGADLRGVNLEEADLEGAQLEGALLDGAYLKNANIASVKLSKQALNELEKMQQLQRQAEDGTLDLRKVNLKYLDLRRLDLRGVDLMGVDLSGVNLVGVNLTGVKIDPMYLDGSFAFKSAAGRTVDIKKGNTAGLDLTTANQMKANLTELEVLRRKRIAAAKDETARIEEINRAATELKQREEQRAERPVSVEPETPSLEQVPEGFAKELELLKNRRLQQPSPEELKSRIKNVELLNRPALDSGARSVVTKRPRRKEELPPSKYDFPILYPVDEDDKSFETKQNGEKQSSVSQMTDRVKQVFKKILPARTRVKRQRQKQRS